MRKAALRLALVRVLTKAARIVTRHEGRSGDGRGAPRISLADAIDGATGAASTESFKHALERALANPAAGHAGAAGALGSCGGGGGGGGGGGVARAKHGSPHQVMESAGSPSRDLWGQYPRVAKPLTAEETISALKRDVASGHAEILDRLGKLEALVRGGGGEEGRGGSSKTWGSLFA